MADEDICCARCGIKLGNSIIREEGRYPAYNLLITKFSAGDLGKQSENYNLCSSCKYMLDEFIRMKL